MLEEEDKLIEISRKRVMHLREVELNYKTNQEVEEAYHITRLDRMILDYLLREGYLQSATQYASQLNIQVIYSSNVILCRILQILKCLQKQRK
jgi:hypothetical protein